MSRYDFTPDESDNALYFANITNMTAEELIDEYKGLMQSRGEGGDLSYNLEMCIDMVRSYAGALKIELPQLPQDKVIFGYIMEVETPESSSVSGYGYDYFSKTLYVRYRNTGKVYAFYEIPKERFEDFVKSDSKGSYVSKLRKEIKK